MRVAEVQKRRKIARDRSGEPTILPAGHADNLELINHQLITPQQGTEWSCAFCQYADFHYFSPEGDPVPAENGAYNCCTACHVAWSYTFQLYRRVNLDSGVFSAELLSGWSHSLRLPLILSLFFFQEPLSPVLCTWTLALAVLQLFASKPTSLSALFALRSLMLAPLVRWAHCTQISLHISSFMHHALQTNK